jgi:hypothetical protein
LIARRPGHIIIFQLDIIDETMNYQWHQQFHIQPNVEEIFCCFLTVYVGSRLPVELGIDLIAAISRHCYKKHRKIDKFVYDNLEDGLPKITGDNTLVSENTSFDTILRRSPLTELAMKIMITAESRAAQHFIALYRALVVLVIFGQGAGYRPIHWKFKEGLTVS